MSWLISSSTGVTFEDGRMKDWDMRKRLSQHLILDHATWLYWSLLTSSQSLAKQSSSIPAWASPRLRHTKQYYDEE